MDGLAEALAIGGLRERTPVGPQRLVRGGTSGQLDGPLRRHRSRRLAGACRTTAAALRRTRERQGGGLCRFVPGKSRAGGSRRHAALSFPGRQKALRRPCLSAVGAVRRVLPIEYGQRACGPAATNSCHVAKVNCPEAGSFPLETIRPPKWPCLPSTPPPRSPRSAAPAPPTSPSPRPPRAAAPPARCSRPAPSRRPHTAPGPSAPG